MHIAIETLATYDIIKLFFETSNHLRNFSTFLSVLVALYVFFKANSIRTYYYKKRNEAAYGYYINIKIFTIRLQALINKSGILCKLSADENLRKKYNSPDIVLEELRSLSKEMLVYLSNKPDQIPIDTNKWDQHIRELVNYLNEFIFIGFIYNIHIINEDNLDGYIKKISKLLNSINSSIDQETRRIHGEATKLSFRKRLFLKSANLSTKIIKKMKASIHRILE